MDTAKIIPGCPQIGYAFWGCRCYRRSTLYGFTPGNEGGKYMCERQQKMNCCINTRNTNARLNAFSQVQEQVSCESQVGMSRATWKILKTPHIVPYHTDTQIHVYIIPNIRTWHVNTTYKCIWIAFAHACVPIIGIQVRVSIVTCEPVDLNCQVV